MVRGVEHRPPLRNGLDVVGALGRHASPLPRAHAVLGVSLPIEAHPAEGMGTQPGLRVLGPSVGVAPLLGGPSSAVVRLLARGTAALLHQGRTREAAPERREGHLRPSQPEEQSDALAHGQLVTALRHARGKPRDGVGAASCSDSAFGSAFGSGSASGSASVVLVSGACAAFAFSAGRAVRVVVGLVTAFFGLGLVAFFFANGVLPQ